MRVQRRQRQETANAKEMPNMSKGGNRPDRRTKEAPVRLPGLLLFAASLMLFVTAPQAVAAPNFGVELTRNPLVVHQNDESMGYEVKVTNTSPAAITCNTGTWTGTPAPGLSVQWLRDGAAIAGATSASYAPVAGDQGHSLQCQVTGTNAGGASTQVTAPVYWGQPPATPAPPPATSNALSATSRPTVAGTTELTCTPPTNWNGAPTWTFQWFRNGAPIAGATLEKFKPKSGAGEEDQNKVLQCLVTGKNSNGTAVGFSNNFNVGAPVTPPANAVGGNPTTTGGEWANGAANLFVSLPPGMSLIAASGWSCDIPNQTCSSPGPLAPGASYPTLSLSQIWIDEATVPHSPTVAVFVSGGGASKSVVAKDTFTFQSALTFGLSVLDPKVEDESGFDYTQAGGHPFAAKATFEVVTHRIANGEIRSIEPVRDGVAELPPGLVGNTRAVGTCPVTVLIEFACPPTAAVGGVELFLREFTNVRAPVYRVPAEKGYAAEFGFATPSPKFVIRVGVRTDGDYGLSIKAPLVPTAPAFLGSEFTFCGFGTAMELGGLVGWEFKHCKKASEAAFKAQPVVTLPTNCSEPEQVLKFAVDSWNHPGAVRPDGRPDYSDPSWKRYESPQPGVTGCDKLVEAWTDPETGPTLDLQPDNTAADSPAGYTAKVHVENKGLAELEGLGASHLRDITVSLPQGVSLNPAVGAGVQTCSTEQMGMTSKDPLHFDAELPHCPPAAKIGKAEIATPLLEKPLGGSVYLAAQHDNPFGSDYAIYLVVEAPDEGIVVKLAGEVTADPITGQVKTTFKENPQLPFEDLKLEFFGGAASALANPVTCGTFATNSELSPWAAEDPANPKPDEIAHYVSPVAFNSGPGGTNCAETRQQRPFALNVTAGSGNSVAGATSPFTTRIQRPDGNQELHQIIVNSPPGYSAYLKGIPSCTQAQIAAARSKTGVEEQAHPSCPAASHLGTIVSGAGPGDKPLYTPGDVYLAGPYSGAPLSIVTITPAVAGGSPGHPAFDLGNVVVQVPIYVDRQTAKITAKTDALPEILKGIPLRIRDIRVNLDRPNWGLNPTNCERSSVSVTAQGNSGATDTVSNPFQVGGCDKLAFKPKLTAKVTGGTQRGDHPAFTAELNYPPGAGYANIKDVQVALPHSEFLDQSHINTICTRVQALARQCPQGSIYGYAEAITPLLDGKLTGPVFLKSSDHQLPDLAIALKGPDGQPVEVEFAGRIDSVHAQIRNTIEGLPDVPVSKFVLKMKGGHKGLLVNSRNLCQGRPGRMTVNMTAQNNKRFDSRPLLGNSCGKAKKHKKAKKRSKRHQLSRLIGGW